MLTRSNKKLVAAAAGKSKNSDALTYEEREGQHSAIKWLHLSRQEKELKVGLDDLRQQLIGLVRPWREAESLRVGHWEPCVLVPTKDGNVQVLFKGQYKKIPAKQEVELRNAYGQDYDRCFREHITVKLRKEVAEDEKKLNEVLRELAKLGDNFSSWFECEVTLVPTEEFAGLRLLSHEQQEQLGIEQIVTVQEQRKAAA